MYVATPTFTPPSPPAPSSPTGRTGRERRPDDQPPASTGQLPGGFNQRCTTSRSPATVRSRRHIRRYPRPLQAAGSASARISFRFFDGDLAVRRHDCTQPMNRSNSSLHEWWAPSYRLIVPRPRVHRLYGWADVVVVAARALGVNVHRCTGGLDDLLPPATGDALATVIPGSRLVLCPNTGYLVPWEQPARRASE
jgi:hypothetical protein